MDRYDKLIQKIQRYSLHKPDTMFDDFFQSDLCLMEECIRFKQKNEEIPQTMYVGTIYYAGSDREEGKKELLGMGIKVVKIDIVQGTYYCKVTEKQLKELDTRYGEFVWSLDIPKGEHCGNCACLSMTEQKQNRLQESGELRLHNNRHICHMYSKRVWHGNQHPNLPRLEECLKENPI